MRCVCASVRPCNCVPVHSCLHMRVRVCLHQALRARARTHARMHARMHAHACMHVCNACTHAHVRVQEEMVDGQQKRSVLADEVLLTSDLVYGSSIDLFMASTDDYRIPSRATDSQSSTESHALMVSF